MSGNIIMEYKLWLNRAEDDILWTKSNIKEGIYYGACFTAQQAVEKALKAYLLYQEGRFDKVHDLVKLIDECIVFETQFQLYREKVAKLSVYYVQTRYPDISELDRFSKSDAQEAYASANEIVAFVRNKVALLLTIL